MSIELITIVMFVGMLFILMLGLPVAFCMGGIGIVSAFFILGPQSTAIIAMLAFSRVSDIVLVAAPLFILMGYLLEGSGIGEGLF